MVNVSSRRVTNVNRTSAKRCRILIPLVAAAFCLSIMYTARVNLLSTSSNLMGSPSLLDVRIFEESKMNLKSKDVKQLDEEEPRGKLRFDWTNMTLVSPMAKRIEAIMSNCSLPLGNTEMWNRNGLGAEVHIWSQKLCNAMDKDWRIRTSPPWQWLDQVVCGPPENVVSAISCYFPKAEVRCPDDLTVDNSQSHSNPIASPFQERCPGIIENKREKVSEFRAASTEYLFQSVNPEVIQEAERQLNLVFPRGQIPPGLITVHIRWGDKKEEMKLLPVEAYVKGVAQILEKRQHNIGPVSVFLATEDPKAVSAFQEAAPPEWKIYVDQYYHDMLPYRNKTNDVYNQAPQTATETKGRAGLVALSSLLVAMEANDFVLTTISNWSRMMNELRKNLIDLRCNGCTSMIDLRSGEW